MSAENLLGMPSNGVPQTLLAADPEVTAAVLAAAGDVDALRAIVIANPTSSLAWAVLADAVFAPDAPLESYAYARVGYHRGLDSLRGAGWKGRGPIPWSHEPNRGVLRALYALRRAAEVIGETGEVVRLTDFLNDADPAAAVAIEAEAAPHEDPAPPTAAFVIRGED